MYCENCGEKLNEDDAYCGNCGTPVKKTPNPRKKNWKWFAILAMLGCIVFVLAVFAGSAIAISRDKKGGDGNNTVSSDGDSQQEEKDVADDEKGATHVTCEAFSEDTELNGEKTEGEYVVATGYDDSEKEIWQFKSDTIPMTEMPTYYEVGIQNNNYYLEVGETLYAFALSNGEQLWSCEVGSSISAHVFDENNNIYVCCYYGPDFCHINEDGEVVKQIDAFYTEPDAMFWPSKIEYDSNKVIVTMDGSSDGEGGTVTVDLKDYSYTRSDEELVERRESAKKAKYKLLTKILKEYKNDEVAPAYSEMDLDGNGIQEIIIRTFTDQATEGGKYIYQIYAYNDAKNAYTCDVEEFYSFLTDVAVHYYYEDKIIKLAVDWSFADEVTFVIYTYDGSGLTEEEVTDDLTDYLSVEFQDITELGLKIYEKTQKEEPADPKMTYDVEDFIGYYCMDVDEELLNKYPNMNPEIIDLYFNEDGLLEAARKYRFGTTGTSNFYPYDSYTIEGNTLICQYSKVESFFDEQSETGEHRYQLTSNGNLIADQEVWFRHNVEETNSQSDNSQSDSSKNTPSPFYGIWCGAAKTEAEAQKQAKKIRENGFDAQVFVTTDWSNLNTEKWYVITAGTYGTKEAASAVLQDVQRVCSDAYIKYSGNWQG